MIGKILGSARTEAELVEAIRVSTTMSQRDAAAFLDSLRRVGAWRATSLVRIHRRTLYRCSLAVHRAEVERFGDRHVVGGAG